MKKLIKLSLIMLFVLASCSKDDNTSDVNSSSFLVGNWEYMAYIDENGYAWTDDDSGSYVFTKDRVKIKLESGWDGEYEYKYLPDSNELIFFGTIHKVEILNNNEIIIRNSCCGSQLQRNQ